MTRRSSSVGRAGGLDRAPVERRRARPRRRCRPAGPTRPAPAANAGSFSGPSTTTPSQPARHLHGARRRRSRAAARTQEQRDAATARMHGYVGCRADAARCAHPRLSARPAGRRARLRGDLRRLAGRRRLHRRLRREGHRGALRRRAPAGVVPAEAAADVAHVPAAAAAVPARDRVAGPARLRHRRLVARAPGRTACWSIPAPCTSATATTRSATRGREREATLAARNLADPARRCACCSRAGASGTGSRPSAWTPTSPTRRSPQARIRRYFGRESTILHPPVELSRFSPGPVGAHYLVLAELMAHKRIDVAMRAFNALGLPLVVVGDGPEWRRLRRLAGPDRAADRPALGRRGRRPAAHRAGARGHRRGGVRDRRGRVAGVAGGP